MADQVNGQLPIDKLMAAAARAALVRQAARDAAAQAYQQPVKAPAPPVPPKK